ncbi:MAG: membrane protein insertase YidC [Holosporaceae bacterium]|nr:MAG: membrane protein insertase YidC [Holosporaceae bacterium]
MFLTHYKESLKQSSGPVALLRPKDTASSYYMESGWVSPDKSIAMPGSNTPWKSQSTHLASGKKIQLEWRNPQGVLFVRTISLDDTYLFSVTDKIKNASTTPFQVSPYALLTRRTSDETGSTSYALHEGAVGYLDGKLKEEKYKDVRSEKTFNYQSKGGWLGFSDKYWLGALLPDQNMQITANYRSVGSENAPLYQTDFIGGATTLQPGMSTEHTFHFFAGAKSIDILDAYEQKLGVPHFDLAIDFGWFYFITRPLFFVLKTLNQYFGNFALAIVVLTLLIRGLLFPLASKSYRSMAKMKELTPELNRIKESTEGDNMRRNQEMMSLYKKHKVNPVSGCLPMFLQIPVLFAIYKVLLINIDMRHAPLFGWIKDMSAPDPTTFFNLFGLIPWAPPSFLMIGGLPILMGFTMYLQQKLSPQPMDEMQSKMFLILPFLFTYMLAQFPAGVVFYWTLTNLLAIAQQWALTRKK